MGSIAQIFIILCGAAFFFRILRLLVKRKINERNSIAWFAATLLILALTANPHLLDYAAKLIGIEYPPSLLFLLSTLILLYLSLSQSIQISSLHSKLNELVQNSAVDRQINAEVQHMALLENNNTPPSQELKPITEKG